MPTAAQVHRAVLQRANPKQAKLLARFFKTGKGQYGEEDVFLGLMVPQSRVIVQQFKDLPFSDIKKLLQSKVHEERLIAILILVHNFEMVRQAHHKKEMRKIFDFYLESTRFINNWDLVDLSAPRIVGAYLYSHILKNMRIEILERLARSENLWERRIAIISTLYFIVQGECELTLRIAKLLLNDPHDLIHKAVGWMLREVGKRCSQKKEEQFLKKYYQRMPRTMLRYAIERFPKRLQSTYLKGEI